MMPRTTGGAVGRGLGQGELKKAKKKTLKETYTLEVTSERFTKLITSLKTAEEERHLFWGSNKKKRGLSSISCTLLLVSGTAD